jgi:hypothetical protein
MTSESVKKWLVVALLGVPLAVCLVLAARWGIADLTLRSADEAQAEWRQREAAGKGRPDFAEWSKVHEALLGAVELQPGNPVFLEAIGNLQLQRSVGDPLALVFKTDGLGSFQRATVLRPTSPYQWANIAWLKHQMGEVDAQFYTALENAAVLGPWEREVQLVVLDVGFAVWDVAPERIRTLVITTWKNAQVRLGKEAAAIAKARNKLTLACDLSPTALSACNLAPETAKLSM